MKRSILVLCVVGVVALHGCSSDGGSGGSGGMGGAGAVGGIGGVGGMGGQGGGVDPTLAVFLSFDGDATDQSGNGNDGTLGGGATANGELVVGDNGDDYLSLPNTVMDGLADFTLAVWLKLDTLRNGDHQVLSGANADNDNFLMLWYREEANEWITGIDNSDSQAFAEDSRIEDLEWHHVALIRSEASALLYLDGAQLGDPIGIDETVLDIDPGGLIFGQDQDELGGGFMGSQGWAGRMDNLRIYDRALSAGEVAELAAESR